MAIIHKVYKTLHQYTWMICIPMSYGANKRVKAEMIVMTHETRTKVETGPDDNCQKKKHTDIST